jgi:DNA-binding beta-propeller fold protein YncE
MYAVRLRGATADALADGWRVVAYPPDADDVTVADETIDSRTITVVDSASTRSRLGTFYLGPRGDTLIVVQAFDFSVAVEALASLH